MVDELLRDVVMENSSQVDLILSLGLFHLGPTSGIRAQSQRASAGCSGL